MYPKQLEFKPRANQSLDSPRLLHRLLVQPIPLVEEADDKGRADSGDGDGKCRLDAGHVRLEDPGDQLGREHTADGGGAGANDSEAVDALGDVQEELVDEGGLGSRDEDGTSGCLEDCDIVSFLVAFWVWEGGRGTYRE